MKTTENEKTGIEKAAEELFSFAIDREDVKILMASLPKEADIKRVTVEYELQLLKIVSAGWCISYYLENCHQKSRFAALYWKSVYEFSQGISETSGLLIGKTIDYFLILKNRLDMYVDAMGKKTDAPEPAVVIGPEFARACGNADDVFTVMTGSKMFVATVGRVKQYLEEIKLR